MVFVTWATFAQNTKRSSGIVERARVRLCLRLQSLSFVQWRAAALFFVRRRPIVKRMLHRLHAAR